MATKLSDVWLIVMPAFGTWRRFAALRNAPPCKLLRCLRKRNHHAATATKQHDGQITKSLSSPSRKNISLAPSGKSGV
jgi:hypothetical protein